MAKGSNQKGKLLALRQIFYEQTDNDHGLTVPEIISKLSAMDIPADRKTLYEDFEELRTYGMDIMAIRNGRRHEYRLTSREFELPELKLLVDAVQSSRFITERKTNQLIHKLEKLSSTYEAGQLQRQVTVSGRIKTMNESIYYSVDHLHEAIARDRQIRFQYFSWNEKKQPVLRHDGKWYHVSPWGLMWDDENYYLVGYDSDEGKTKHFRVDKMSHVTIADAPREGKEAYRQFNLSGYSQSLFGVFSGRTMKVTLEVPNSLAGVIIDRFGKNLTFVPVEDKEAFRVQPEVTVSPQFYGWAAALPGLVILDPPEAAEGMKEMIRGLCANYGIAEEIG